MKNRTIYSFFKTSKVINSLDFGKTASHFNGAKGDNVLSSRLERQFHNSFKVVVEARGEIEMLKLTNQNILTWDDYWLDEREGVIIDPGIKHINLQRNDLIYVNMSVERKRLHTLNLEGNSDLKYLHIHKSQSLSELVLDGCTSLEQINLGLNYSYTRISAKGCKMRGQVMEQLLRDFRPVITSSGEVRGAGMFRKTSTTLLDLTGNTIDWSNRRIASKIRMLLTNNWEVRWDNPPPTEIIPLRMYAFPVESRIGIL
jgi:hypothetical protein